MLLEDNVDAGLEHERVIDGDEAHSGVAVPARLATTSDRAIHHIIADQEESLEQLGQPTQETEMRELLVGQGLLQ